MAEKTRLEYLIELRDALEPQVTTAHSEHGLQGVSGLVGQYRACLAEIDELRAKAPKQEGTVLDELKERRAVKKPAARSARSSRSN